MEDKDIEELRIEFRKRMEENELKRRGTDHTPDDCSGIKNLIDGIRRNEFDICLIKDRLHILKEETLVHMKKDIDKLNEKVEKIDGRLWTIIMLVIGSIIVPIFLKYFTGE